LEPIQNEVFNLGTQTNRWQELFSTNVNCDLLQTVTTGFLHLNGSLEPLFDNIYNLGTMANNWQDTFTTNLNCDILQTISTGFIHVNGSLEPFDDKLFDLGSNVAAWSSLHVENINFCGNIFDINGSQVITTRQNPVSPPVPSVAFDYNRGNLSPNNTGNIAMSPLTSEVQSELVKIQNEINGNIEILRQTVDDLINKLQVHGLIG
jgi:hypothetical protein